MYRIALKMLFGDRIKFFTLVIGITFAAVLINLQGSIFTGLMKRFASFVYITQSPVWVMDQTTEMVDAPNPLPSTKINEVRSINGVQWAEPMMYLRLKAKMNSGKQVFVQMVGIDPDTLIGMPQTVKSGSINNLNLPDAVVVDANQLDQMNNPAVGTTFEINDHRAVIVGIVEMPKNAFAYPVIYTTYDKASIFAPPQRNLLSYLLVKPDPSVHLPEFLKSIENQTDLKALSEEHFAFETIMWYLKNTGIPVTFGMTVTLGVIVGAAIAAQTFYTFTLENLRHFATLKAIGATNLTLIKIIFTQSFIVGFIAYGLSLGIAAVFGSTVPKVSVLPYFTPYPLLILSFLAVVGVCSFSSIFSIIRIVKVEPAIVFRG